MYNKFILILLCICPYFVNGQSENYEKKLAEIRVEKNDTLRAFLLCHLGVRLIYSSLKKAEKNCDEAYKIFVKYQNPRGLAETLQLRGSIHTQNGRLKEGWADYLASKNICEKNIKKPWAENQLYLTKGDMAGIAAFNGDYETAISFYLEGLNYFEKTKNIEIIHSFCINISNTYSIMGYDEKALFYGKKALEASKKLEGNFIIWSYKQLIITLISLHKMDEAKQYLKEYEKVLKKIEFGSFRAFYYILLGYYELTSKNFQSALNHYTIGLKLSQKAHQKFYIVDAYDGIAEARMGLNQFELALKPLQESKRIAQETGDSEVLISTFYQLYKCESKLNRPLKAIEYLKKYVDTQDSVKLSENKNKALFLAARFQSEKQESQISDLEKSKEIQAIQLKQKTTQNILLVGVAIAIALFSFLGYRNYKHKQEITQQRIIELEIQQQLTATEAILKGEDQERTRIAKDLHDGLGGMLSGVKHSFSSMRGNFIMTPENAKIFERSIDMVDASIQEMRRLAHNMMPEALLKFGLDAALMDYCGGINDSDILKINYKSIGLEKGEFDQSKNITIYRIIQELTNNIIKHSKAKTAIVQLIYADKTLDITVEDDGIGFDKNHIPTTKGIGWTNITNRVDFLKGSIEIDSEVGKGTSVFISFLG
jgi:two-component system, NarL family, sensor kinase